MRFKLTLRILPGVSGKEIPINYQYELSSAIYKMMSKGDADYASWLHDNAFRVDNKTFKLFTFSRLSAPFIIDKNRARLVFKSDFVTWNIAFLPERSTKEFVTGIFKNQSFEIGDSMSGATFQVSEIQIMPELRYNADTIFETMSPVCISHRNENGRTDYLSPEDERYTEGILSGLISRYTAFYGKPYGGEKYCNLKLLSKPKSSLITIKAGTPAATRVRGYSYKFKLELPAELMQIAYESGLGEKGSLGFGMIKTTRQ